MKIAASYSHLNGLEFLLVHHPRLWTEIQQVVASVDAEKCRTKLSKEKRKGGAMLYSPITINEAMKSGFGQRGWAEQRTAYRVTKDDALPSVAIAQPEVARLLRARAPSSYKPI